MYKRPLTEKELRLIEMFEYYAEEENKAIRQRRYSNGFHTKGDG